MYRVYWYGDNLQHFALFLSRALPSSAFLAVPRELSGNSRSPATQQLTNESTFRRVLIFPYSVRFCFICCCRLDWLCCRPAQLHTKRVLWSNEFDANISNHTICADAHGHNHNDGDSLSWQKGRFAARRWLVVRRVPVHEPGILWFCVRSYSHTDTITFASSIHKFQALYGHTENFVRRFQ